MRNYAEVSTQSDASRLEDLATGFVDSVVREVSLSRGPVGVGIRTPDVRAILALPHSTGPLELFAHLVISVAIDAEAGCEEDGGSVVVTSEQLTDLPRITVRLKGLDLSCRRLFYRLHSPPELPHLLLGDLFPDPNAGDAILLGDGWIQCPGCMDAFVPSRPAAWHRCPRCLAVLSAPE